MPDEKAPSSGALVPSARRFPPPWSVEETDACFIVRDANGQARSYVYFEEEPGRRAAAKLLTRDEARASPVTSPSCRSYWAGRETVIRSLRRRSRVVQAAR